MKRSQNGNKKNPNNLKQLEHHLVPTEANFATNLLSATQKSQFKTSFQKKSEKKSKQKPSKTRKGNFHGPEKR